VWAWRFAVGHFLFLLGILAGKPFVPYVEHASSTEAWHSTDDMVAARHFHYADENALVRIVAVVDFPALLLGSVTATLAAEQFLSPFHTSYVDAASWLLLGSAEWFLFGHLLDRLKSRPRGRPA
jgi:hypothetical protein